MCCLGLITVTVSIIIVFAARILPEEVIVFEDEKEICVVKLYEMGKRECAVKYYENPNMLTDEKPVIYLYPEDVQQTRISLDYKGTFVATYPAYENGWQVTAYPNGKLVNSADGKEYSYLFWEGAPERESEYDWNEGFVVAGEDTASFLQEKLSRIGLVPKEYNEFIVYWMPRMQGNKYNLVRFASKEEYADYAQLTIEPEPDSILRVFMAYKALDEWQEVHPQHIQPFERRGFTVVEWGGVEIR